MSISLNFGSIFIDFYDVNYLTLSFDSFFIDFSLLDRIGVFNVDSLWVLAIGICSAFFTICSAFFIGGNGLNSYSIYLGIFIGFCVKYLLNSLLDVTCCILPSFTGVFISRISSFVSCRSFPISLLIYKNFSTSSSITIPNYYYLNLSIFASFSSINFSYLFFFSSANFYEFGLIFGAKLFHSFWTWCSFILFNFSSFLLKNLESEDPY